MTRFTGIIAETSATISTRQAAPYIMVDHEIMAGVRHQNMCAFMAPAAPI